MQTIVASAPKSDSCRSIHKNIIPLDIVAHTGYSVRVLMEEYHEQDSNRKSKN